MSVSSREKNSTKELARATTKSQEQDATVSNGHVSHGDELVFEECPNIGDS